MKQALMVLLSCASLVSVAVLVGCQPPGTAVTVEESGSSVSTAQDTRVRLYEALEQDQAVFGDDWKQVIELQLEAQQFADQLRVALQAGQLPDPKRVEGLYTVGANINERASALVDPHLGDLSVNTQLLWYQYQADLGELRALKERYIANPNAVDYQTLLATGLTVVKALGAL